MILSPASRIIILKIRRSRLPTSRAQHFQASACSLLTAFPDVCMFLSAIQTLFSVVTSLALALIPGVLCDRLQSSVHWGFQHPECLMLSAGPACLRPGQCPAAGRCHVGQYTLISVSVFVCCLVMPRSFPDVLHFLFSHTHMNHIFWHSDRENQWGLPHSPTFVFSLIAL